MIVSLLTSVRTFHFRGLDTRKDCYIVNYLTLRLEVYSSEVNQTTRIRRVLETTLLGGPMKDARN